MLYEVITLSAQLISAEQDLTLARKEASDVTAEATSHQAGHFLERERVWRAVTPISRNNFV